LGTNSIYTNFNVRLTLAGIPPSQRDRLRENFDTHVCEHGFRESNGGRLGRPARSPDSELSDGSNPRTHDG
jgi:hypothetical protein